MDEACVSVALVASICKAITPLAVVSEIKKKQKDAERKRKWRRQKHLQKQVNEHPASGKKIKVWCGNASGEWKLANQQSKFCVVNDIGKRNKKRDGVLGAIVKFDGKDELEIVEKNKCMEEKQCLATQGDHDTAEYFNAIRLLDFGANVRVKWLDRREEQWLPSNQVRDLSVGPRRTRSKFGFRYKPGQTLLSEKGGDPPPSVRRVPKTSPLRIEMDKRDADELSVTYYKVRGTGSDGGDRGASMVDDVNEITNLLACLNMEDFVNVIIGAVISVDRSMAATRKTKKKCSKCESVVRSGEFCSFHGQHKKCKHCINRAVCKGGVCRRCYKNKVLNA